MKTFTRAMLGVICVLLLIGLTAFFSPPVWAGTCNPPEGTVGKSRFGETQACRDGTAVPCTGMMLGDGDVWVHCKADEKPEPAYCPERNVDPWRGEDGSTCDADVRGSYTGEDHRLPRTLSGPRLINNFNPRAEGQQVWACDAGRWVLRGQWCRYPTPPATSTPAKPPRLRKGDARVGSPPKPK